MRGCRNVSKRHHSISLSGCWWVSRIFEWSTQGNEIATRFYLWIQNLSSLRWFTIIIKTIFWDTGKDQTIIDLADWSCPKNIAKSFAPDEKTLIGNLLQLNDYISWPSDKTVGRWGEIGSKFSCKSLFKAKRTQKIGQSDVNSVNDDDDPWLDSWTVGCNLRFDFSSYYCESHSRIPFFLVSVLSGSRCWSGQKQIPVESEINSRFH